MKKFNIKRGLATIIAALLMLAPAANAGVFNMSHFVAKGSYSIGLEPEMNFAHEAAAGANLKYTMGISDWTNFTAIMGTYGGTKNFRLGGAYVMDIFPDVPGGQPGIGLGTQLTYVQMRTYQGLYEFLAIPYLHKKFLSSANNEFEPFVAIPLGMDNARDGLLATISVGSILKKSEHFRFVFELGVAVVHTESYFSGGFVYYP